MDKRGINVIDAAFFLIAGVFIVIAMIQISIRMATTGTEEEFLTKDSAIMVDSLLAVPGDVSFNYQTTNYSKDMNIQIKDKYSDHYAASVRSTGSVIFSQPFRAGTYEVSESLFTVNKKIKNNIIFEKQGNEISVRKLE